MAHINSYGYGWCCAMSFAEVTYAALNNALVCLPFCAGEDEMTALHIAAQHGHADIILQLCKARALLEATCISRDTPLATAIKHGKVESVQQLIARGCDINAVAHCQWHGLLFMRPLHAAVCVVQQPAAAVEIVQQLLSAGADVNAESTQFCVTPLLLAVELGCSEVVQLLLQRVANLCAAAPVCHGSTTAGGTAFTIAAQLNRHDVLAVLLHAIKASTASSQHVNTPNLHEHTPLMTAACFDNLAGLRALLANGADVNAKTGDGRSCMMIASSLGPGHFNRDRIVAALLKAGATVDAKDNAGRTALMFASRGYALGVVTLLLQAGADVTAVTPLAGITSLMFACGHTCNNCCASSSCDAAVVAALLRAGAKVNADMNAEDAAGRTALFAAAYVGRSDLVVQLLRAGAAQSINHQASDGSTALHCTTAPAVVAELLRAGAQVTLRDVKGRTALHSAISSHCSISMIQQLLQAGVYVAAAAGQNEHAEECLSFAAAAGHTAALVQLLQAWPKTPAVTLHKAAKTAAECEHWHAAVLLVKHLGKQDMAAAAQMMRAMPAAIPALKDAFAASEVEHEAAALRSKKQRLAEQRRGLQVMLLALAAKRKQAEAAAAAARLAAAAAAAGQIMEHDVAFDNAC
jgi:ankyrin repeat protein